MSHKPRPHQQVPAQARDVHRRVLALVSELESKHGIEVVIVSVGRAGLYEEILWKAFGLGATVASIYWIWPRWAAETPSPLDVIASLMVSGSVAMVFGLLFKPLARRLISRRHRQRQVSLAAAASFLSHRVSHTYSRRGVLVYAAEFERELRLIVDRGLSELLTSADLNKILAQSAKRCPDIDERVHQTLIALGEALSEKLVTPLPNAPGNEIPNLWLHEAESRQ